MSENIVDLYTEEAVTKILRTWYPQSNITVNESVVLKVYEIIEKSGDCTTVVKTMSNFVGGPIGTPRSLTGPVIKAIRSALKEISENQQALICIKAAALFYKAELEYLGM